MEGRPPLVLDASAALVLFASGHAREIVHSLPMPVYVVEEIIAEVEFLRRPMIPGGQVEKDPIDWQSVLADDTIGVLMHEDPREVADYLRLALEIDDGEAAAAAAALNRGYDLVIDDQKARRILGRSLGLVWSLDLVHYWAERSRVSTNELKLICADIRVKANYLPHRNHPLLAWWHQHFELE